MKSDRLLTLLTVALIGILLVLLQSCKDDAPTPDPVPEVEEGPDELVIFTGKLSATWKMERAIVDGVDVSGAFKNMSITFRGDKTYSVANTVLPIWPASGSFQPQKIGDNQFNIKRNDGVTIDVTSPTDSKLVLELFYTSHTGRATGVSGHYKFEMSR